MQLISKIGLIIAVLMLLTIAFTASNKVQILQYRFLPASESVVKQYDLPKRTDWRPIGEKQISANDNPNARQVTIGRALHTDTHGSDEISTVIAPAFEVDWTTEKDMFITEGPVFNKWLLSC